MKKLIIAFISIASLVALSAEAGQKHNNSGGTKVSIGATFDATATGGFAAAAKSGNAKSKASNENAAASVSSNNNGKVSTQQSTGSVSSSSSSAKNNGIAASASGGFAGALGGAVSVKN